MLLFNIMLNNFIHSHFLRFSVERIQKKGKREKGGEIIQKISNVMLRAKKIYTQNTKRSKRKRRENNDHNNN